MWLKMYFTIAESNLNIDFVQIIWHLLIEVHFMQVTTHLDVELKSNV